MQHWLYPMLLQYPLHSICHCIKDFGGGGGGGGGQISAQMGESSQCKSFPSSEFAGVACRQRALVRTFSPIEEQILQSLNVRVHAQAGTDVMRSFKMQLILKNFGRYYAA